MIKKKKKVTPSRYRGTNLETMRRVFSGIDTTGKFWKSKPGENLIRILPSNREDGAFAYKTYMHHGFKIDGNNRAFPCLAGVFKKPCPACKVISYHSTDTDPDVKELIFRLQVRNQFMMNIIDRSEGTPTVRIFSAPISVAREINNIINDEDYGDITDPDEGRDVKINRTGEGLQTRYSVRVRVKNVPVGMEDWEDNLYDLEKEAYIEIPSMKTYIKYLEDNFGEVLDIAGAVEGGTKEEEDEEEEDEEPVVEKLKRKKSRKIVKKSKKEMDDEL